MKAITVFVWLTVATTATILSTSAVPDPIYAIIIGHTFESIKVFDNTTLIGQGYQINEQFALVDKDLVANYDNYYEHLFTATANGTTTSNVLYIWKNPRLFKRSEYSILVLDNLEHLEEYTELFWKAMEVVGEEDESTEGIDLNEDGQLELIERIMLSAGRLLKQLFNIYFLQNILNRANMTTI